MLAVQRWLNRRAENRGAGRSKPAGERRRPTRLQFARPRRSRAGLPGVARVAIRKVRHGRTRSHSGPEERDRSCALADLGASNLLDLAKTQLGGAIKWTQHEMRMCS